jgi:hypothetical protein
MRNIFFLVPHIQMTHLDIWSDDPASQFKNCYIAEFLQHLCGNMFHRVDAIDWHFFATSHGKGPCDALGGSVKRMVRQAVMSHKDIVQSAEEMAAVVKPPNIEIIFINDVINPYEEARLHSVLEKATKLIVIF